MRFQAYVYKHLLVTNEILSFVRRKIYLFSLLFEESVHTHTHTQYFFIKNECRRYDLIFISMFDSENCDDLGHLNFFLHSYSVL